MDLRDDLSRRNRTLRTFLIVIMIALALGTVIYVAFVH
jgi:hypothetical protein